MEVRPNLPPIPSFRRKIVQKLPSKPQIIEEDRRSRQARGYGYDWEKLQATHKVRCKGLCEECLRRGFINHMDVVDHILPIVDFPDQRLDPENLQGLCGYHHNSWKRSFEDFARKRNSLSMLTQWCRHPETRPAHFKIMKRGPISANQ